MQARIRRKIHAFLEDMVYERIADVVEGAYLRDPVVMEVLNRVWERTHARVPTIIDVPMDPLARPEPLPTAEESLAEQAHLTSKATRRRAVLASTRRKT